ncbi:hypothetical protein D030_4015A, partial [Vibrio parahaemolyticus AQ3810]
MQRSANHVRIVTIH